ncbi:General transcription factor II-I repeat domain-containing protein 2 [Merluccius polli]|uniref:General transcription factor II-I repeat domain-containing protein 2 n=1 Tax=Merluccius polli TaxID=89951 RepID=A0AA47MFH2_MERPO|nr:General transcription factor II-I repeat domain-containing protein 2 [Merluccius polli]
MDSIHKDLPLHCSVRWLSGGMVLDLFVECFDAIKAFLIEKEQDYPELEDEKWLVKLMFLRDITGHLNKFNVQLHGTGQTVLALFDAWTAFVAKIGVYSRDIERGTFRYFKHLKELLAHQTINPDDVGKYMRELESEFSARFQDFQQHGPVFSFFIYPGNLKENNPSLSMFQWMGIEEFEMLQIELKASSLWASKFTELRKTLETSIYQGASILACWDSLPEKFEV